MLTITISDVFSCEIFFFSGNDVSLNFCTYIHVLIWTNTFSQHQTILVHVPVKESVDVSRAFYLNFVEICFKIAFCKQHIWILTKHLQHSHAQDRTYNLCIYLFEIPWTGLDRKLTINHSLSTNLILHVTVLQFSIFSLYWYWEFYVSFCILS